MSLKKNTVFLIKLLVGLSILGLLLYKVGFMEIAATIPNMKIVYIIPVIVTYIVANYLGGLNIKILLNTFKKKVSAFKLFRYYTLTGTLGLLLPGRLGEVSMVYFLKKEKVPLGMASAIVIMDKLISIVVVGIFTFLGLFIFLRYDLVIGIMALFVLILTAGIYIISSKNTRKIARKILGRYSKKFRGFSKSFFKLMQKGRINLFFDFVMTVFKWILSTVIIYPLFLSLGQAVPFYQVLLLNSIIAIASIIPLSPNGLGIRESFAVFIFAQIGIDGKVTASVFLVSIIIRYTLSAFTPLLFPKDAEIIKNKAN